MEPKETPGFEQAMQRLQDLLEQLQDENTPLSEAVKLYAEAAQLIACCQETLEQARLQIEEIDLSLAARGMGDEP